MSYSLEHGVVEQFAEVNEDDPNEEGSQCPYSYLDKGDYTKLYFGV